MNTDQPAARREQIEKAIADATAEVATWSAYKQNILSDSAKPMRDTPRTPVDGTEQPAASEPQPAEPMPVMTFKYKFSIGHYEARKNGIKGEVVPVYGETLSGKYVPLTTAQTLQMQRDVFEAATKELGQRVAELERQLAEANERCAELRAESTAMGYILKCFD